MQIGSLLNLTGLETLHIITDISSNPINQVDVLLLNLMNDFNLTLFDISISSLHLDSLTLFLDSWSLINERMISLININNFHPLLFQLYVLMIGLNETELLTS